jgi:hypothetical protein
LSTAEDLGSGAAEVPAAEADPAEFVDRRQRPTPMISRYTFLGGRRRSFRSVDHKTGSYVDLYDPRTAILMLVFFTLTVFDAVATVYYIDHVDGTEFNPIAQWMLDRGRVFFVFAKGVPTMVLLLFVLIHKNFRYGRAAIGVGFGFYFLLTVYHLVLQALAYRFALLGIPVG